MSYLRYRNGKFQCNVKERPKVTRHLSEPYRKLESWNADENWVDVMDYYQQQIKIAIPEHNEKEIYHVDLVFQVHSMSTKSGLVKYALVVLDSEGLLEPKYEGSEGKAKKYLEKNGIRLILKMLKKWKNLLLILPLLSGQQKKY